MNKKVISKEESPPEEARGRLQLALLRQLAKKRYSSSAKLVVQSQSQSQVVGEQTTTQGQPQIKVTLISQLPSQQQSIKHQQQTIHQTDTNEQVECRRPSLCSQHSIARTASDSGDYFDKSNLNDAILNTNPSTSTTTTTSSISNSSSSSSLANVDFDDDDDEDEENDFDSRSSSETEALELNNNETSQLPTTLNKTPIEVRKVQCAECASKQQNNSSLVLNKRRRNRRRQYAALRNSHVSHKVNLINRGCSTNCEPIVSCLNQHGLQITDVDLIGARSLLLNNASKTSLSTLSQPDTSILGTGSDDEQLSTLALMSRLAAMRVTYVALQLVANESQLLALAKRFAWFPPSLASVALVEEFFAKFSQDKVPLINSLGAIYRDEQLLFQVPRQDVSLDYCSYPIGDEACNAFVKFTHERNSRALSAARVVRVRLVVLPSSSSNLPAAPSSNVTATNDSNSVLFVECLQLFASSSRAPKCRRCLARFDDKQLAVLAPNFVIDSLPVATDTLPMSTICDDSLAVSTKDSVLAKQTITKQNKLNSLGPSFRRRPSIVQQQNVASDETQDCALFHPTCFTCATCKEFLVDLVYCKRDTRLLCVRHYGETERPRCSWCQELIFTANFLKTADNLFYHIDHLLCSHCDESLARQSYVQHPDNNNNSKSLCVACFEKHFAPVCEACKSRICVKSQTVSYKDKYWHEKCFLCTKCHALLVDKPFGVKLDKVYCAECYDAAFASHCDACNQPFRAGSIKMDYRGRQWHDRCFVCCGCNSFIGSQSFIPKNQQIYCVTCYEDKYATRCTRCATLISGRGVTFRGEPWHKECFTCNNCHKQLAGQRFATKDYSLVSSSATPSLGATPQGQQEIQLKQKDDDTGCKEDKGDVVNVANYKHNTAFCLECHAMLFAKKCHSCNMAITGSSGTRFVSFESRSWHNDCFKCHECSSSLVNKGFINDGPDLMLCGECARLRLM